MSVPWSNEPLDRPDLTGWTVRRLEGIEGWYVEGPCPKCGHTVSSTMLDGTIRGVGITATPVGGPIRIPVRCNCADVAEHGDDRPGCGRSWTVEIHP
jgi:hypothetical protein